MSFQNPKRLILVVLFIGLLQLVTPAISNAQRKEIERLRLNLNKAFQQTAINTPKASSTEEGPVVQPTWTAAGNLLPVDGAVRVTQQGLAEVQAIRAELNRAIAEDTFVPAIANSPAGNPDQIRQIQQQLEQKSLGQNLLKGLVSSAVASNQSKSDTVANLPSPSTQQGGNGEEHGKRPLANEPNIVEAFGGDTIESSINIRKLERLEVVNKRRTREMFLLTSIEEDFSFNVGYDVEEWEHITHAGAEYFIGRRRTDLQIIQKQEQKYVITSVLEVGEPISYLETYSYWDTTTQQHEGVVLVASGRRVLWFSGKNGSAQIERQWQWTVGHPISGLRYFNIESRDYLTISSNESSRSGYYALSIYQFDLNTKEFWIAQRLQLRNPCGEVRILDTGRDIILGIPQNNTADLYVFNPRLETGDHLRFQLLRQFDTDEIKHIAAFQMGGRSYFALGGRRPQILLYQQGDFISRTILGNNYGLVDMFFPIPVRTYRDDLILLVQHRVDFGTHRLTVLETLIWDGDSFVASIPVPCRLGVHTVYGVGCMLDLQRDEGLKGAFLLRRGYEVSIVVPRRNAESGLFRLHTQLMAKNSELLDLQDIFAFLQDWVKEQDDLVTLTQRFLAMSDDELNHLQPDLSNLAELNTLELFFNGDVGRIMVNDYIWKEEDINTDLSGLMQAIETLETELMASSTGRIRRDIPSRDMLELTSLEVDELQLKLWNDKSFFVENGHLRFPGIINVNQLDVLEEDKLIHFDSTKNRQEQNHEEFLLLDGNLEFETINGISWQKLLDNLVFNNKPLAVDSLEVKGEVVVEGEIFVEKLNTLNFPDDYLWQSGPSEVIVHGETIFLGNLSTNVLYIDGNINGMNTNDAITLNEKQHWNSMPTFTQLDVAVLLELNGTAKGRDFEDIPINPTLHESNILSAACQFRKLQVLKNIHLYGDFDNRSLGSQLGDVVLEPDLEKAYDALLVVGKKTFSSVEFPIDFNVLDDEINGIPVKHFITLHTAQYLNMSSLSAMVYFGHLNVSGTYDGVRIEELMMNAMKIDELQHASTTQLNFADGIFVTEFNVRDTLNSISLSDGYQKLTNPFEMEDAEFEHIVVQKMADLLPNITGNPETRLNGKILSEIMQGLNPAELHIHIKDLYLENGLKVDVINDMPAKDLFGVLEIVDDLPEMIIDGEVEIDHIIVLGDVWLRRELNGENFNDEFLPSLVWLNRENYIQSKLHFLEPIEVHGDMIVLGDFNGEYFKGFLTDMVSRIPNGSVEILAPKKFLHSVLVSEDTSIGGLNGVPFKNFATKEQGNQHFIGQMKLCGNLLVKDLEVHGNLNGYPMSNLTSRLVFEPATKSFVLLGDIEISSKNYVFDDLTVFGQLNDIRNLSHFFVQLVYKDNITQLNGNYTFSGRVSITGGLRVKYFNDMLNVNELLSNVVLGNDQGQSAVVIKTPVVFKGDVYALNGVTMHGALQTNELNGCLLNEWLSDTLRTDEVHNISIPLIFDMDTLNDNHLQVNYLNGVDLSNIVTLHTPQNFTDIWEFSNVYLDGRLDVLNHHVNGRNLQEEFKNTLMTHGDQLVSTPLILRNCDLHILDNLHVNSIIDNDKHLNDVATLHGKQNLETPIYFKELRVIDSISTEDTISGIDMNVWHKEAIIHNSTYRQYITGKWNIGRLIVRQAFAVPPTFVLHESRDGRQQASFHNSKHRLERSHTDPAKKLCREKLQPKPYRLRHLEWHSELPFALDFAEWVGWFGQEKPRIFVLAASSTTKEGANTSNGNEESMFLLLNFGCKSYVYVWHPMRGRFKKLCDTAAQTGKIHRVVRVGPNKILILNVAINMDSSAENQCKQMGLNIWQLNGDCFVHVHEFPSIISMKDIHLINGTLFALSESALFEMKNAHTGTQNYTRIWKLPKEINRFSLLRFVYHPNKILFTEGQHLYALSCVDEYSREDNLPISIIETRSIFTLSTPHSGNHGKSSSADSSNESNLKPSPDVEHQLTFPDFQHLIVLILLDLIHRLNAEIKITELSIPESDLYDEHLLQDFIDIMMELQKQEIYPPDTFNHLVFENLDLPSNPPQVLAARTVVAVWPVIVEMQQVSKHLRGNDTKAQPICACLFSQLKHLVSDVLIIANNGNVTVNYDKEDKSTKILNAVIERVREFQEYLKDLSVEMKADIQKHLKIADQAIAESEILLSAQAENQTHHFNWTSNANFIRMSLPSAETVDSIISEVVSIQVGMNNEKPQSFLATIKTPMPSNNSWQYGTSQSFNAVNIFHLSVPEKVASFVSAPFQTLPAQWPRLLHTLRIRDETLLAYVEQCCHIHVFLYRGVQGFIPFTQFRIETDILELFSFRTKEGGYYLATLSQDRVTIFEVMIAESKSLSHSCK